MLQIFFASENGNVLLLEYDAMRTEQQATRNCKENELLKQIATTFIVDTGIFISQAPSGNDKISPPEVLSGNVIVNKYLKKSLQLPIAKMMNSVMVP